MRRTAVIVAATLALLLVACGGGDKTAKKAASTSSPQKSTATAEPDDVPASWKAFSADGATLSLPPEFVGGEVDASGTSEAAIRALGDKCEQSADAFAQFQSAVTFIAVDSGRCSADFVTNLVITREDVPSGTSPREYLDSAEKFLPRTFDVREKETISLDGDDAGHMIIHGDLGPGAVFDQEYFAVLEDGTAWSLIFSAGPDDFARERDEFHQVAETFAAP